ncbi:unnamed protein product, partial [Brenthis ino]
MKVIISKRSFAFSYTNKSRQRAAAPSRRRGEGAHVTRGRTRARHAGRPPGARSPAEHLPRKYHTALLVTASVFHLLQM